MNKKIIVAIDGPSGAGKSTAGKLLAERLGYIYIDTGAMYRAIGLKADRAGIEPKDGPKLCGMCRETEVELRQDGGVTGVFLDGEDVTGLIRTPRISMMASAVSAVACVRERLLELQRKMGEGGGVVLDGRDIGTVVFPGAGAKFYLDADVDERARRRCLELEAAGQNAEPERVAREMKKRDHDDSHRDIAPLAKAKDAVLVDTSDMSIDEVVSALAAGVEAALAGKKA